MNYSDYYYHLGDVIRGTVRDAQELLCRQNKSFDYSRFPTGHHGHRGNPVIIHPAGLPQSLGELCLSIGQDAQMSRKTWKHTVMKKFFTISLYPGESSKEFDKRYDYFKEKADEFNKDPYLRIGRDDIKELRRAMYHRNLGTEVTE